MEHSVTCLEADQSSKRDGAALQIISLYILGHTGQTRTLFSSFSFLIGDVLYGFKSVMLMSHT